MLVVAAAIGPCVVPPEPGELDEQRELDVRRIGVPPPEVQLTGRGRKSVRLLDVVVIAVLERAFDASGYIRHQVREECSVRQPRPSVRGGGQALRGDQAPLQ